MNGDPAGTDTGARALLAGWFSIERGDTAGDLLALEVVEGWLTEAGWPHDVAAAGSRGVDWSSVDPDLYSHVVVICGPAGHGLRTAKLISRFSRCRLVGVNLSMIAPLRDWNPFDVLIERDSARASRPDLAFLAAPRPVPVVGRVLAGTQREYARPMHDVANQAIERLLAAREVAVVPIDTRMPPKNKTGWRTPAQVEAVVARMDMVVTTRLHGLVLALKNAVPALAVDAIGGGAKVRAQANATGWPAIFTADDLDEQAMGAAMDWCLSPEARRQAGQCAANASVEAQRSREQLLAALGPPSAQRP